MRNVFTSGPAHSETAVASVFSPRPLFWVVTPEKLMGHRAAPFSAIMPIANAPPLILLAVQRRGDGTSKRTAENLIRERRCSLVSPRRSDLSAWLACGSSLLLDESKLHRRTGLDLNSARLTVPCTLLSTIAVDHRERPDLFVLQAQDLPEDDSLDLDELVGAAPFETYLTAEGLTTLPNQSFWRGVSSPI